MLMTRIARGLTAAALVGLQVALASSGTAAATTPPSTPTITFVSPSTSSSGATLSYSVNRATQQIRSVACSLASRGGSTASATCGTQTTSSSKSTSYSAILANLNAGTYTYGVAVKLTDGGGGTNAVSFTIKAGLATCSVTPYTAAYDGAAHTATGTCTGASGVNLSAYLNLAGTTHTNAGSYPSDHWTFTDPTGNYTNPGGTISDAIGHATANCTVTSYSVTYDASPHSATGSCTGVNGVALPATDLDLSNTTHTAAAGYPSDKWTFTDPTGNYTSPGGTVTDAIGQATANCTVSSYSMTYDASSHTATGSCTGVNGVALPATDLDLSNTTHTYAGNHSDTWSFADANYTNPGGTVTDTIAAATANCTVTAYSATYDGKPRTAAGSCTGVGGVDLSADMNLTGTTHTSVSVYANDGWSFADPNGNYTNPGGTVTDVITAPLPAIAQIHIDYPYNPQNAVVPPSDVSHCPSQDPDNGGCAINELDGTIDNVFDASSSVDPNVDPGHDRVDYHWQIFYPSIFGSQVAYTAAGITGYHTPVLHIVPGSLPQLDGDPRVGSDIFWRVELTITINGFTTTTVYFRFAYASDFSLEISSDCQLTGQFMGTQCSLIAPQLLPTSEPV